MDVNMSLSENYHQMLQDSSDHMEIQSAKYEEDEGAMMERQPSPPQTQMKTRKGSRKGATKGPSHDETARQRGRPRVDPKDQTAAERRRTQIRLAQRAYRQRKETTISGLNQRVLSLERTVQDMHQCFLKFQAAADVAELFAWNPDLAASLDRSATDFMEWAKNGVHETDAEGDDAATVRPEDATQHNFADVLSSRDMRPKMPKRESHPSQSGRRRPSASAKLDAQSLWGYSPTFEHLVMVPEAHSPPQSQIQDVADEPMQRWEASDEDVPPNQDVQLYQVQLPEPTMDLEPPGLISSQTFLPMPFLSTELPLPKTFSSSETSFARRLLRQSLEAAVDLLSSPFTTQERFDHFCRYTLCYTNRPNCLAALKQMIASTAHENLEFWKMPSYHHGGAGLHFPRVGIDSTSNPPDNWAETGPIGPTFPYQPQTDRFYGIERARIVAQLDVDGEWFDSNDVEQYLKTKGIVLDGNSSIVELTEPPPQHDDDNNNDNEEEEEMPLPGLGRPAGATTSPSSSNTTHSSTSTSGPQSPPQQQQNDDDDDFFIPSNAVIYGEEELFNTDPLSYDDVVHDVLAQYRANINIGIRNSLARHDDDEAAMGPLQEEEFNFNLLSSPPPSSQVMVGGGKKNRDDDDGLDPHIQLRPPMDLLPEEADSYFMLRKKTTAMKKKKVVHVERFLDYIVPQGVCLGRTPGFRREVVDQALHDAITEVGGMI